MSWIGRRSGRSTDRKSTRLNSSHVEISYAVFCLKKKNEMQQQLLHRSWVGFDHAAFLVRHELYFDIGREPATQNVERVAHELGEDQRLQVEHPMATEAQQPLRQLGAALGRELQLVDVAIGRQRLGERGGARQDRGEELVELLRNGARQPADRLHLLGLLQCSLARELRGDVFSGHSAPFICGRVDGVKRAGPVSRGGASLSNSPRLELARYLCSGGVAASPHTLTEAPPYARLRTSQIDRATSSHPPPDECRPPGASGHIVARGEGAADLAVVEDAIEGALDAA